MLHTCFQTSLASWSVSSPYTFRKTRRLSIILWDTIEQKFLELWLVFSWFGDSSFGWTTRPPCVSSLHQQIQLLAKNLANPKDKEKFLDLKERHYRAFLMKINKSNNNNAAFPISSFMPYKYYIGRGNNSILVRASLKQRFWWSMGDFESWEEYNFMWT